MHPVSCPPLMKRLCGTYGLSEEETSDGGTAEVSEIRRPRGFFFLFPLHALLGVINVSSSSSRFGLGAKRIIKTRRGFAQLFLRLFFQAFITNKCLRGGREGSCHVFAHLLCQREFWLKLPLGLFTRSAHTHTHTHTLSDWHAAGDGEDNGGRGCFSRRLHQNAK